jgi:hypothetical protein
VNTKTFYHPYNTRVGCANGSRTCALPYSNKVNKYGQIFGQPSAKSNEDFLNAIFSSNSNPVVSYNRRLENLKKVLSSINTLHPNFFRIVSSYYTTNQNKKKVKNKLTAYMNHEHSPNRQIQEKLKINYLNVQRFVKNMKNLKNQQHTLPSKTPTREQIGAFMKNLQRNPNNNFGPGR